MAVSRQGGETVTREAETGHAKRDENMVEFAGAALSLLRDTLKENDGSSL